MTSFKHAAAFAAALVIAGSTAQASETLSRIVTAYLQIQTELAGDKIDGIKMPASAIAAACRPTAAPAACRTRC